MVLFAVAGCSISIHALRVEGDRLDVALRETQLLFLSTPSGWRATKASLTLAKRLKFLSTPSGWRATTAMENDEFLVIFLSTPSGWRATTPLGLSIATL